MVYDGVAIFDLNTPFIGVPEALYTEILNTLQSTYGLDCFDPNVYLLGCVYQGNYLDLPAIKLDDNITIPPQVYLHPLMNNTFNLLINPLSSNSSDFTSTFVTQRYENFVILGSPFLQYYYVCFEARSNYHEVSIHEKDSNQSYNSDVTDTIHIVLAVVIPVLLCCIFIGLSCRKGNNAKKKITPEETEEVDDKDNKQSFVLLFDSTDKASLIEPLVKDNKFVRETQKPEDEEEKSTGSIFDTMGKIPKKKTSNQDGLNFNVSTSSEISDNIN